ncbi:MAG: type VI secretion system protein TssA [Desulfobacteraceae bacterium]
MQLTLETYTTPIPGANPSGRDLRYTPVYDRIKEAKRADDRLDRGEWHTELKRADWPLVEKLCGDALQQQTKDLQIAAWFAESLVHQFGFGGLAFGLELITQMLTDFWDTLYPTVEDGDLDFRIGPFTYLNEKLPAALCQVPLCDPERTKGFNYFDRECSRQVGFDNGLDKEQKERRRLLIEEGKITGEEFASAVIMSPLVFYKTLHQELERCTRQLNRLEQAVNQRFEPDPPGFSRLGDALKDCARVVKKVLDEKQKSEVEPIDQEAEIAGTHDQMAQSLVVEETVHLDEGAAANPFSKQNAISDISADERAIWKSVAGKAGNGHLKNALDQLMAAAALAPSVRQKNRYLLLVAKLCLRAGRHDLAKPIAEQLYELIESLHLEKWEHPAWIAEVIETLYRCLEQEDAGASERAATLFQKLCTLNITKAATFRLENTG